MKKSFKEKIINSMFIISKKPVLFRDLLEANASFNEGMLVDPSKLNFRFLYGRSYIVFCALWLVVVFPLIAILHGILADIDFHISVLFTMILTASCFVGFDVFKAYARKRVTHRLIRGAFSIFCIWKILWNRWAHLQWERKMRNTKARFRKICVR